MNDNWLPLEKKLEEFSNSRKDEFANQHVNYWVRYKALLTSLRLHVYPNINAGLSYLSKSPGFYTDHGDRHFDEVVKYAGLLIEDTFAQPNSTLNPYELYLLLCAIRVHDAGNIDGREDHEKRAFAILKEYGGDIQKDAPEHRLIGDIAQAHGGRTINDNDKDTIGALLDETVVGGADARPRMVAAIVRFADEICEHSSRAAIHHINQNNLTAENKLFQLYAKSIAGAKPDRKNKTFKLRFNFDVALFNNRYLTPKDSDGNQQEKYLIDDALDRIDKLNHERVYCNRFLLPQMQTDQIETTMEFTKNTLVDGADMPVVCERRILTIRDKGYPSVPNNWKAEISDINGPNFAGKAW